VYTVIYDGRCRVCQASVELLRRWDRAGRFELLAFQDPAVPARFPAIPAASMRDALQLAGPDGTRWEGAAALERILTELPAGSALAAAFRLPVMGRLLDRAYRWFARHRYRFGCSDHCRS